jgi:signal transduction histidine kinase
VRQTGRGLASGTGLGLPFAKSLVELHDGSLVVSSAKGKGTSVRVTLPTQVSL